MANDEIEFYENMAKIEAFKTELAELFKKHNVKIKSIDEYGADDETCKSVYYLAINDFTFHFQNLNEIIEEIKQNQR